MSAITNSGVPVSDQSRMEMPQKVPGVISMEALSKVYAGGFAALQDIDLTIAKAETLGLLGPNGAGKSTLIRLVCGLTRPSSGRVLICGVDPQVKPAFVKTRLCGLLQGVPIEPSMRVHEVLDLFGKFYPQPLPTAVLLELVGLSDKERSMVRTLSGGQRQRLAIARALVGNPEILVLDEPTTGLDVAIRRELIDLVRRLKEDGRTVIISTHYLEEAEELCDRVAILCGGKLLAADTPIKLIRQFGSGDRLQITLTRSLPHDRLQAIRGVTNVQEVSAPDPGQTYLLTGRSAEDMLQQVVLSLTATGILLQAARVIRSGLEGAYLQLTGERIAS